MSPRDMQAILHQACPRTMPLTDFAQEVTLLGSGGSVESLVSKLRARAHPDSLVTQMETTEHLMATSQEEFEAACTSAPLTLMDAQNICIALGSATHPFTFPHSSSGATPPSHALTTTTSARGNGEPKRKGGTLKEACEILDSRRERFDPLQYNLPITFARHAQGSIGRNEQELRHLIIQEMEDFHGDLYPSAQERDTVLNKVTAVCGPPLASASWNWWYESIGQLKKKHKGTSISDLERARRNPQTFGVTGRAIAGRMRPARPPWPSNLLPQAAPAAPPPWKALMQGGVKEQTILPAAEELEVDDSDSGSETPLAQIAMRDVFKGAVKTVCEGGILDEGALMRQIGALRSQVQEVQRVEADSKSAKAAAGKAARAAKAAAKKPPAKDAKGNDGQSPPAAPAEPPQKSAAKKPRGRAKKPRGPPPSAYELQRTDNIAFNDKFMNLIDDVQSAGDKIIEDTVAVTLAQSR